MRAVAAKMEPLLCKQLSRSLPSRLFYQSPAATISVEDATPEELQVEPTNFAQPTARTKFASELLISEEVLHVLATVPDIETPLEYLVPIFSPHLVVTVLEGHPQNTASAFRFFNWASRRANFRSRSAYRLMVSRLQEDPVGLESAWDCLSLLQKAGVPVAAHAFEALIGAYELSGMPTKVMECYDRMVKYKITPTTFVYNAVMSTLVKKDVLLIVSAVYSQMVKANCRSNRSTFGILIDAYRREGESDKALAMLDEMSRRGFAPSATVVNNTIHSLCEAGRMKEAVELLNRMRSWRRLGFVPEPYAYNMILDGYCKLGKIDKAFDILNEFQGEGFVLGLRGYTSLIDALLNHGKSEEAVMLYKEMLRHDMEPDCVLYTMFMKHLSKDGKIKEAFELLKKMTDRGIKPDTYCYNTLIKALCDVGNLDGAKSLILQIFNDKLSPNDQTYNILICGLCRQGLVQEARDIFDEMEKQGCLPPVATFNALINGLCKSGKPEEAHAMFRKMEIGRHPSLFFRLSQASGQLSNCLHELEKKWCESGQVAKAGNMLQEIKACGIVKPDATTFTTLINHYCEAGDLDCACKLYEEIPRRGLSPDDVTFSILINAFLRKGQILRAEKIFDDMKRTGCKARLGVLCVIMRAWCKIKLVSAAVRLWLDYLPIIEDELSVEGLECISMAKGQFSLGLVGDALRHLIKIDIKNASRYSAVYNTWLSGFCEAEKLDEALQIWIILKKYNIEVTSYSCRSVIEKFGREGWLDVAVDSMTYIIERQYEIGIFHTDILFHKLCKDGKQEVAVQLASDMSKAGYNVNKCLSSRTRALLHRYGAYLSRVARVKQPGFPP